MEGSVNITVVILWKEEKSRLAGKAWVENYYASRFGRSNVIVETTDEAPFNRGKVINSGVKKAKDGVVIISDADCFLTDKGMNHAIELAKDNRDCLVVPHNSFCDMTIRQKRILLKKPPGGEVLQRWFPGSTKRKKRPSGIWIADKSFFQNNKVPEFSGWGYEDSAYLEICKPKVRRTHGKLFHIRHRKQSRRFVHANKKKKDAITKAIKAKENIQQSTGNNYFIKDGYRHRLSPAMYSNPAEDSWQEMVYSFSRELADSNDYKKVLDIGCGSGHKLTKWFDGCETCGIEIEEKIRRLNDRYPDGNWVSFDPMQTPKECDLIVCADVIEHLPDPDILLDYIERISFKQCVISTPERDACRGYSHLGPPQNKCHAREWNQSEFYHYMKSRFRIDGVSRVPQNSKDRHMRCQLLIIGKKS